MRYLLRTFVFLSITYILCGCTNAYQQSYIGRYTDTQLATNPYLVLNTGEPEITPTVYADIKGQAQILQKKGYVYIGQSSFNGLDANASDLRDFAKKLGAFKVLMASQYSHTESGIIPVTTPETTTSYHSGTIDDSEYHGVSTRYGMTTTYMPFINTKNDYCAVFFGKRKPGRLGIEFAIPTEEQKQDLGSNQGIAITLVVEDTAAYRSDLMVGDIILEIFDKKIYSITEADELLQSSYGKKDVPFTIYRKGQTFTKRITVEP